jgi:energy-coupling factor transport system substrate-specific component
VSKKVKLTTFEIVLFGVLGALTFAAKLVMSPLPNIEPASLMIMLFAVTFGWKALYPTGLYVAMEVLYYGINVWNIYYLYVWAILAMAAYMMRKMEHPLGWALLSGGFGLAFGLLCAPVDFLLGDLGFVISKWVSGIPFDLMHCAGNFVIALVLFKPLRKLTEKLYAKIQN